MKMTIEQLQAKAKTYVDAAKQAGAWRGTTDNLYGLIDKIGKQVMIDGQFLDKLPELDGEELPLGKTIEEYFIDLTLPESYTTIEKEGAKDIVPALPSVEQVAYSYTLGREKFKTTVPYDNFERAALSASDAANMSAKVLQRLNNSYKMWKFAAKKQLLGNLIDKADAADQSITISAPIDTASGEAFIKQVKKDIEDASFAHEGGLAKTLIGAAPSLTLYVKKGTMPSLEVDTLAGAFNRDNLAIPATIKVVDDFGTLTTKSAFAVLVDSRGVRLHRGYHAMRTSTNADGDFVNFVDHSEHTGFISKYCFVKVYKGE